MSNSRTNDHLIKIVGGILILVIGFLIFNGCAKPDQSSKTVADFKNWDDVINEGKNKEVTILMWGGNESINHYMYGYVAKNMKERYVITLKRVPMNASDLKEDSGILIEGYEGIWGRAQLVLTYDSTVVKNPPKTYAELLKWAKENPRKFTYSRLPDDFVGSAFVRNAFYELTGDSEIFQSDLTDEEFERIAQPVLSYFRELNPYLWNKGQSFQATQEHCGSKLRSTESR